MSNAIVASVTRAGRTEPFDLQVARNQIMGHTPCNLFGFSASVGNTNQALWDASSAGGNDYVFPTSAAQLSIVSSSTSDTSALSVQVNGTDANFNAIQEIIALNGTTAVTTVNSYYRINNLYITNGSNVGTITATQGGATVYGQINPGVGQTQMAVFTVPLGYIFYKQRIDLTTSITSGSFVTFKQWAKFNLTSTRNNNGYACVHQGNTIIADQTALNGSLQLDWQTPYGLPQGTDIKYQVQTSSGGSNGAVSAAIYGYLVAANNNLTVYG